MECGFTLKRVSDMTRTYKQRYNYITNFQVFFFFQIFIFYFLKTFFLPEVVPLFYSFVFRFFLFVLLEDFTLFH